MQSGSERAQRLLSQAEYEVYLTGGFGKIAGLGDRLALLVIDVQNYMVAEPSAVYPSACGDAGGPAVARIANLIRLCRTSGVPIVYSRLAYRVDGLDLGMMGAKRSLDNGVEGWCFEGTAGVDFVDAVAPRESDIIITKTRASAFFGTPLASLLSWHAIDSVLVVGGSTSNCVRATAVDASALGYRVGVVEDCVFDRFQLSHEVALFDLQRLHADVMTSADVAERIARVPEESIATEVR